MSRDKILFISHHRESSGWGHSACQYIRAFRAAGFDVAARPIRLNGELAKLPPDILEAEQVPSTNARYLVQYVLPPYMEYSGEFDKCVGMAAIDSVGLEYSGWLDRLGLMDAVWTLNNSARDYLASVLSNPVHTLHVPCDTTVYDKQYEPIDFGLPEGTVKFYTIAEANRRKNLSATIKAFHLAFPKEYPVALIIKMHQFGADPNEIFNTVHNITVKTKESLRLYKNTDDYHEEIVMTDNLSLEDICRIHQSCDCYVSSSFGEGFGIPVFDALGFGNTVIAPNTGGPKDFVRPEYLVEGNMEPVFSMTNTLENLFTAREDWFNIDVRKLASAMRRAYSDSRPDQVAIAKTKEFSYNNIGNKAKTILEK